jgi:hypothetical protein
LSIIAVDEGSLGTVGAHADGLPALSTARNCTQVVPVLETVKVLPDATADQCAPLSTLARYWYEPMPVPPTSVDPAALMATFERVQTADPPETVGAVGATVSTVHLYTAVRVVLPLTARTVNECAPAFSLVYVWVFEHFAYAPEPSRQETLSFVPVAFHPNFALVERTSAAGWVVIFTDTAVVEGIRARAAAGAAISRQAKAATMTDRGSRRSVRSRENRWESST